MSLFIRYVCMLLLLFIYTFLLYVVYYIPKILLMFPIIISHLTLDARRIHTHTHTTRRHRLWRHLAPSSMWSLVYCRSIITRLHVLMMMMMLLLMPMFSMLMMIVVWLLLLFLFLFLSLASLLTQSFCLLSRPN